MSQNTERDFGDLFGRKVLNFDARGGTQLSVAMSIVFSKPIS